MASDRIYLRAGELLDVSAQLLTAPDRETPGALDRAYVALSTPALDCPDQLTVHVDLAVKRPAGILAPYEQGVAAQAGQINIVSFVVMPIRCAPRQSDDGNPPPTSMYEAVSQQVLEDLWILWRGLPSAVRGGTLWTGACDGFALNATPVPESGGMIGWAIRLDAELTDG